MSIYTRAEGKDRRWWLVKDEPHANAWAVKDELMTEHATRRRHYRVWEALYNDDPLSDGAWSSVGMVRECRTRHNIVQNGVDTAHSQIVQNRPRPTAVTIDGDFSLQQKAKKLTKFLDGCFEQIDIDDLMAECCKGALIFGTGIVKVFVDQYDTVCSEIVWPGDLLTDPLEDKRGRVRTLYQIHAVDRSTLCDAYPKFAAEIEQCDSFTDDDGTVEEEIVGDMAYVVEAWHLPSSAKAKDGRHIVCVSNATLFDEVWKRPTFPFVFQRWATRARGFWGIGLAERMAGAQDDLNRLTAKSAQAFDLSAPFGIVDSSADLNVKQIDNTPHRWYSTVGPPGQAVSWITPDAISEQHLRREDTIIQRGYEFQGVSQFAAEAQKPAGLNSGKAMLVHQDVASGRMVLPSRNYEAAHIDIAKAIIDAIEEHCERYEMGHDQFESRAGGKMLELVKYSECRMRDQPHEIRVFPVSALSKSPQGRIQEVLDMVSMQLITDPMEIRALLDLPDLDRRNNVDKAGRDLCDKMIEDALDGRTAYAIPEMPLDYMVSMGTLNLCLARRDNASEAAQQRLRDLIGSARTIMEKTAAAQAAAMPPPQPPMMPAAPMEAPAAGAPPI